MVDRFEQEERYGPDSTIVKRTRFNQTIEPYRTNEVPAKPGVKPHSTVKELPALPVREHQQDNMLQCQDNMIQDEEVVNFGQRVQQPQHQQQLQLQQHNIPHNPVFPKHSPSILILESPPGKIGAVNCWQNALILDRIFLIPGGNAVHFFAESSAFLFIDCDCAYDSDDNSKLQRYLNIVSMVFPILSC